MDAEPENLDALLARIRGGDESALAEVLQRYEPQLRLAARVMLGPRLRTQLDSLDLVQSVHRVLLPGLRVGKYDVTSISKLLALARTVVRRKVIRNWRRMNREQATETSKTADQERTNSVGSPHTGDPFPIVALNDLQQHILSGLTGSERELIELRIQGYSTVEIAEQLQCDAHALRARFGRLRQRLRKVGFSEWL